MNDSSPNSKDPLKDGGGNCEHNGQQLFKIDSNDLCIEVDGHDHNIQPGFDIVSNVSESYLEIECDEHENSEHMLSAEGEDHDHNRGFLQLLDIGDSNQEDMEGNSVVDDQQTVSRDKYYAPPVVGMEFESYDDAYNYYNCYAKELGFATRVKSSWTKRNSKEKRGAVLCCNCEGFKTPKEVCSRRKETRTGCLAMIRLRLVESNRWRVDEVKLEHNHSFDPERAQNSKSHKKIQPGDKRKFEPALDVEVRTIKLYRAPTTDAASSSSHVPSKQQKGNRVESGYLKLKDGEAQAIQNYFCQAQLMNPNFFYVMDLNDEGRLKNVFWIEPRARAAYAHFGDVVALDTTCISNKSQIPLGAFVGINHHGQSILLGCGLLADETVETYVWLFRAWLTCMLGRPPQIIVTDRCSAIQTAISDVFPRAHHHLFLPFIIQSIVDNLRQISDSDAFHSALDSTVYDPLKVEEFEIAWENMIQHFGLKDHRWLRTLYEERERWAHVYLKDTFLAGLFARRTGELLIPVFQGYVHDQTSLKEFFDIYDSFIQMKQQDESLYDSESIESIPLLTSCYYELQLSKLYTKPIFDKFSMEVESMSCLNIIEVNTTEPVITYIVKEHDNTLVTKFKTFEVMYDKAAVEVRCICGCFYLNGYLCRHVLCVLSYNGFEEIPSAYVLARWRKDHERMYVTSVGSENVDIANPVQLYEHLYRKAMQVVEEGMVSQDHYMVAWQAFKETLNKVRLTVEKHVE